MKWYGILAIVFFPIAIIAGLWYWRKTQAKPGANALPKVVGGTNANAPQNTIVIQPGGQPVGQQWAPTLALEGGRTGLDILRGITASPDPDLQDEYLSAADY